MFIKYTPLDPTQRTTYYDRYSCTLGNPNAWCDNLLLPICPKCGDTKHVVSNHGWKCTECQIQWNFYGRIEKLEWCK